MSNLGSVPGNSSFGNGDSVGATTATTVPAAPPVAAPTKTVKPKPAARQSIAKAVFAKAGAQLSGHASWAVLIALTLFCLLGLLFRPVRELPWIATRIARLRSLPGPWRHPAPGATP